MTDGTWSNGDLIHSTNIPDRLEGPYHTPYVAQVFSDQNGGIFEALYSIRANEDGLSWHYAFVSTREIMPPRTPACAVRLPMLSASDEAEQRQHEWQKIRG